MQVEKELQKTLDQKGKEIQFLKKSFKEKEKYLKEVITNREQQVLEHKGHLRRVEGELESKKKETTHLQECFQNVTVELEGKTVMARQLQETNDEIYSQLKAERERIDKYVRQSITAEASSKSYATKTEVNKTCFYHIVSGTDIAAHCIGIIWSNN